MKGLKTILQIIIPVAIATGIFVSCGQSREDIGLVEKKSDAPEDMDSVRTVLFSEGDAVAILNAPKIQRFTFPNKTVFPEGLEVIYYDSLKRPESRLTAGRGVHFEQEDRFEVFDNVIVYNYSRKNTLFSEHLIWEKRNKPNGVAERILRSDVRVRIIDGENEQICAGGVADEKLSWYEFDNCQMVYNLKDSTLVP